MKKCAVIILNYNTYDDTVKCVESIYKYANIDFIKIYIVDNCSPDGSGKMLQEFYSSKNSSIKVIFSNSNLGFSGGNNIGLRTAIDENYEFLFLLNSDVIILNDIFTFMVNAFDENPEVAIVGPSVFSPNNQYVQFARNGLTMSTYLLDKKLINHMFPKSGVKSRFMQYDIQQDYRFIGMLSGCCFGIRASFVKEINYLDDNVFMYYEEDILAYKLKEQEQMAMIVSNAKIIHNEGTSTQKSSIDRLMFTRLHRWTSALYVLHRYAHANWFLCKLIATNNIIWWKLKGIKCQPYRDTFSKFVSENKRILSLK